MIAKDDIRELAHRIGARYHPDRIILFGSYARGNPTPDSDVDLLVVLPHTGKNWRMAAEIRAQTRPKFPLDLIVRAPHEMRERLDAGDPFIREIAEQGEVLYEAHHA